MNIKSPIKSATLAVVLLTWQVSASADLVFSANPGPAYPPACISVPLQDLDLSGDKVAQFYSGRIWLEVAHKVDRDDPFANLGEVQLDMYRLGCAEANRSVIIAEFRLPPDWVDPRKSQLVMPVLAGVTGFDPFPLEFKREANTWGQPATQFLLTRNEFGDYTNGWDEPRRFSWRYVLDVSPAAVYWDRDDAPKYYNGQFGLEFYRSNGEVFHTMLVPATKAVLSPARKIPLGGRLSGNWVENGSPDQGLLLSFSTTPPDGSNDTPELSDLLVFLSWFTFDAEGKPLWLTGTAQFGKGRNSVSIPIEWVRDGSFLGSAPAQRNTVGIAQLRAVNCNLLKLEYQLDDLGLGSGVMRLERLLALEIADYPCRDYEGLQSSIYPPESY